MRIADGKQKPLKNVKGFLVMILVLNRFINRFMI